VRALWPKANLKLAKDILGFQITRIFVTCPFTCACAPVVQVAQQVLGEGPLAQGKSEASKIYSTITHVFVTCPFTCACALCRPGGAAGAG
jgi:hypothetical protein